VTSPPYWGLRDYRIDRQIGLEQTPDAYVAALVAVFREVRRVLRDDGVLFLNLGDSYAGGGGFAPNAPVNVKRREMLADGQRTSGSFNLSDRQHTRNKSGGIKPQGDIKPKDLVGIPWMVAFALRADGWHLRSDIIWHKPNPMPESVTDRPTKAHEYVFLLTKSERYAYHAKAIQEASIVPAGRTMRFGSPSQQGTMRQDIGRARTDDGTRNARTVWTIATQPYSGAHFATMPEALVRRCVLAGSRPAGKRCDCDDVIETPIGEGATVDPTRHTGRAGINRVRRPDEGTRPITRREQRDHARQLRESPHRTEMAQEAGAAFAHYIRTDKSGARPIPPEMLSIWRNLGWIVPTAPCACPDAPADLVFDPFGGSGTTARVALSLGRKAVYTELNPAYLALARQRTHVTMGLPLELLA
jgi:DNA modification methylase